MKKILIFLVCVAVSFACSEDHHLEIASAGTTASVNEASEVDETNDEIPPQIIEYNDLSCDSDDFPTRCKTDLFELIFRFEDEPNTITIVHKNWKARYKFDRFFEGLNYSTHHFKNKAADYFIFRLIYEYSSTYIVVKADNQSCYLLGSFDQDDLINEQNEYVENDLMLSEDGNALSITVGDDETFETHSLDRTKQIKLN